MNAFTTHKGIIAPLQRANVDTDQIIAKQFLKSIKRTGFGESLFYDWRYQEDGTPNADFELNNEAFNGASLLVAGNNFGCGSSREHAVWAVDQYGFRVVIAPSKQTEHGLMPGFADIFRNNCGKNGILTIELSEDEVKQIFKAITANPGIEATADLNTQTLTLHASSPLIFKFQIDSGVKHRLLNGLDDIGTTLSSLDQITTFETQHNTYL